ncbi:unnamed protein product [Callosobruchus maculatus]|uniref:Uncharacterized protein n=1 Tax=Callosobruchus maculatus TaxID=64391 RepID=A0A653DY49_CALMS|nr:unnamed protein product [Callosobruchus maculatus]
MEMARCKLFSEKSTKIEIDIPYNNNEIYILEKFFSISNSSSASTVKATYNSKQLHHEIFLHFPGNRPHLHLHAGSLVGSLVGVDADVLSKKGGSECGKGKGDGKGSCKESSKGGLVDVDLDVLSSS